MEQNEAHIFHLNKLPKVFPCRICVFPRDFSPELPAPDFSKDEAKALAMAPQRIVRIPMFDMCIYVICIYIF